MTTLLVLIGALVFLVLAFWYFLSSNPAHIAALLRYLVPLLVGLLGLVTVLLGRFAVGVPVLAMAAALLARARRASVMAPSPRQRSTVRSAMLDMELDHDSGEMNGLVLAGSFEGRELDDMSEDELFAFAQEVAEDDESAQLLEAYLDRRMPGWRERHDADTGPRHAGTRQSGAMTHEEAYQVLGLEAGATVADIRDAHRRLMQRVHPDVGGSSFLASRINEAKDLLLRLHDN